MSRHSVAWQRECQGGIFIILSILWGWKVDKVPPDRYDYLGSGIILLGVWVMMYLRKS
uniref:hypothetical protein n=1 Tax=Microseira wollei TaxID=467598 RepID=UPI001CFF539D|nr:hypothetical protein [Microseira wollei]